MFYAHCHFNINIDETRSGNVINLSKGLLFVRISETLHKQLYLMYLGWIQYLLQK